MKDEFRPPHWSQFLGINFRKLGIYLLIATVLLLAGGLAHQQWRKGLEQRLLRQSFKALQEEDVQSGILFLRQALQRNPGSVHATMLMAQLSEAVGSPATVLWYERLAELQPRKIDERLKWASVSLRFGDMETAARALDSVKDSAASNPAYHDLQGMLAIAQQDYPKAEKSFAAAAHLNPGSDDYRFKLAVVRVETASGEDLRQSRETLSRLSTNMVYRADALRALFAEAGRRKAVAEAVFHATGLMQTGKATISDRISFLALLRSTGDKAFAGALQETKLAAMGTRAGIGELSRWMCAAGLAKECLDWLSTAPKDALIVQTSIAVCFETLRDWASLKSALMPQSWDEMEFLRLAYLSRAERALGSESAYVTYWREADQAAKSSMTARYMLGRKALDWGWLPEAESVFRGIANARQNEIRALGALHKIYALRKDEAQLLRVTTLLHQANRNDLVAANNFAHLGMLLRSHVDRAHAIASENYERHPDSTVFRSTQGFALYQQKKFDEAHKVMSQIPEVKLQHPGHAGYYGLVLESVGQREKARTYLDIALGSDLLLPTERQMMKAARDRIP